MADQDPIIVAVELGTSRIAAIAGKHKDGNLLLMAFAEEPADDCIKHGIIYNMDKTTQALHRVIMKLQTQLKFSIDQLYVGIGGQSVRGLTTTIRRNLITKSYITTEQMDSMRSESYTISVPDCELFENLPQEYRVDGRSVDVPVGVEGLNVEATYLNIIGRRKLKQNIRTCFDTLGLNIAEMKISAMELAAHLLTDQEKRAGCALVDLGAGTTTVAIYSKNILRHLVTIPLGIENIVADLCERNIEPDEARRLIREYADASLQNFDDEYDTLPPSVSTSFGQKLPLKEIEFTCYARLKEIVDNAVQQITLSPYANNLISGIVLTGGGSRIKHIDTFFEEKLLGGKVRIAHEINDPVTRHSALQKLQLPDSDLGTLLALLASGTLACTGEPYEGGGLFDAKARPSTPRQKEPTEEEKAEQANKLRVEQYKDAIRQRVTETNKHTDVLKQRGSEKKIRKLVKNFLKEVYDVFDEDYDDFLKAVEDTPSLKQPLRELQELKDELEKKVDDLDTLYAKTEKENSFLRRLLKGIDDMANE